MDKSVTLNEDDDHDLWHRGSPDPTRIIEQVPEQDLLISMLAPGLFLRQAGMNAAHAQMLADLGDSTKLPPIIVQLKGLRVIDGMHRLEAARLRQQQHVSACLIDCDDDEALLLGIKLNTLHGLPLSRQDRVAGAKRVLAAHPDWSDRAVAEVTGLGAKTIGVIRSRSLDGTRRYGKRLGRDGKRRPISGQEGRLRAAEYIKAHPDASLRKIARETDISLGTVHDVRERLRREADVTAKSQGEPKEPPGQSPDSGNAQIRPMRNTAQQQAWETIFPKLASDPSLRYTENGREFLRWMATHAAQVDEWGKFIGTIPVHWRKDIGVVAASVSEQWSMFAEQLKA